MWRISDLPVKRHSLVVIEHFHHFYNENIGRLTITVPPEADNSFYIGQAKS